MLNRGHFVSIFPSHLAADAESLQWVEAEPAGVPCLSEAVHELCVERPLQGGQTHQDHMLLFRGQLVLQDVMTSPGTETKYGQYLKKGWKNVRLKRAERSAEYFV